MLNHHFECKRMKCGLRLLVNNNVGSIIRWARAFRLFIFLLLFRYFLLHFQSFPFPVRKINLFVKARGFAPLIKVNPSEINHCNLQENPGGKSSNSEKMAPGKTRAEFYSRPFSLQDDMVFSLSRSLLTALDTALGMVAFCNRESVGMGLKLDFGAGC